MIDFSISRAIGRAPNARSKPLRASQARAAGVSSIGDLPPGHQLAKLVDVLVDDALDLGSAERDEVDDGVEAVPELGREDALEDAGGLGGRGVFEEAHLASGQIAGAGVGRHDQDDVAEVGVPAVRVGQGRVIHHLQQDREQVRMRLLDLVEQQHRMRRLPDRVDQQSALFVADVARRRADQPRHRVLLHVLRHVEAQEFDLEHARELPRQLRLADAGRTREQEVAHRLVGRAQARARQLDRRRDLFDRRVLPEDHGLQLDVEILQRDLVVARDGLHRHARDLGDDLLDVRDSDFPDPDP